MRPRASRHDDFCQITNWIFVPNKNKKIRDTIVCTAIVFFFYLNRTLFIFNPITKKKWAESNNNKKKRQLKTFPLMHFDDKSMCIHIYMINAIVFSTFMARMKEISTLITIYRQIFVSFVKLFMHVISNWLLPLSHIETACLLMLLLLLLMLHWR